MHDSNPEDTIRLSARWVLLLGVSVLFLGAVGGALGNYFWSAPQAPLVFTGENDGQPITALQEITISPSKARAEAVAAANLSTLLLATQQGTRTTPYATGLIVTNDGLLVTTAAAGSGAVVAFDQSGQPRALDLVGRDDVFGLTYYRLKDTIIVPLQARGDTVPVGTTLTAVTREPTTYGPRAHVFTTTHDQLPQLGGAVGVQRLLAGTPLDVATSAGSPLVDDSGQVAGVIVDPEAGTALSMHDVNQSIARTSNGQREHNPFEDLGFSVQYQIESGESSEARFVAVVTQVRSESTARAAGLVPGDRIYALNGEPLRWEVSILPHLSSNSAYSVSAFRGTQELNLTFNSTQNGS